MQRRAGKRRASQVGGVYTYSLETAVSGLACQVAGCGVNFDREDDLERHHSAHLEHQLNNIDKIRVAKSTNNKQMDTRPALQNLRLQTYARLRERRLRRELTRHQDCPPIDHYAQDVVVCQVCEEVVHGALQDHTDHVTACLAAPRVEESNFGDYLESHQYEEYEEYEWAGQMRVRASSLLLAAGRSVDTTGFTTIQQTDEKEELDVTGDNPEDNFGAPQYSDVHLDQLNDDWGQQTMAEDTNENDEPPAIAQWNISTLDNECNGIMSDTASTTSVQAETVNMADGITCRVCLDKFVRPLVSTVCWHVHCEFCWLRVLKIKKLCPQCKGIVKPLDLRRIYL